MKLSVTTFAFLLSVFFMHHSHCMEQAQLSSNSVDSEHFTIPVKKLAPTMAALVYAYQGNHEALREILKSPKIAQQNAITPLLIGCFMGNTAVVRFLHENNISIDRPLNVLGETPLHAAVYNMHIDLLTFLLSQDVDVNASDGEGCTPLFWSVARCLDTKAMLLLLKDPRTQINKTTSRGSVTALIAAIGMLKHQHALLLIEHGADINKETSTGITPLMNAAGAQKVHPASLEVLVELIKRGADQTPVDKDGKTFEDYLSEDIKTIVRCMKE